MNTPPATLVLVSSPSNGWFLRETGCNEKVGLLMGCTNSKEEPYHDGTPASTPVMF